MNATRILGDLLERVDYADQLDVSAREVHSWPDGVLPSLESAGVLAPGTNATGLECQACEKQCWVTPELRHWPDGTPVLVHICPYRDDTAHVRSSPDELRQWRVDLAGLGRAVGRALMLPEEPRELVPGRLWRLGSRRVDGTRRGFYLSWGLYRDQARRLEQVRAEMESANDILFVPVERPPLENQVLRLLGNVEVTKGALEVHVDQALPKTPAKAQSLTAPLRVPPGTTWDQVAIAVVESDTARSGQNDTVEVTIGAHKQRLTFVELGMVDRRQKELTPNFAWGMLLSFARGNGSFSWESAGASYKLRRHISALRQSLREAFGIEENPIPSYRKRAGWQTRFALRDDTQAGWGPLPTPGRRPMKGVLGEGALLS